MSGSVLTTINELLKIRPSGYESMEMLAKAALKSKNYIDGSENNAILTGKWLSFDDRKWLNFKRPLTYLDRLHVSLTQNLPSACINNVESEMFRSVSRTGKFHKRLGKNSTR